MIHLNFTDRIISALKFDESVGQKIETLLINQITERLVAKDTSWDWDHEAVYNHFIIGGVETWIIH